jgi:hypothetical protein
MVVGGPEVVGVVDGAAVVGVVDGLDEALLHAVRPKATTDRTTRVRVRARVMGQFLSGIERRTGTSCGRSLQKLTP